MRTNRYLRAVPPAAAGCLAVLLLSSCSSDDDNGGNGGAGGAGGTGGSGPDDTSLVLLQTQLPTKIDLLFMIDNSASMADKQTILAAAVPDLVQRLTNPVCVDRISREQVGTVNPGDSCDGAFPGSEREFDPVSDIHIGVITSSLGGHGADSCSDVPTQQWNPRQEDMSHLITRGKDDSGNAVTVDTYQGLGFLNWDPEAESTPPGESNVANLMTSFSYMVRGADQDGCGFEASLEAWYRFLIDPEPYQKMIPVPCFEGDTQNQCRGPGGVDQIVLQQRADFLRPDSLVAIVMLTDENDCSLIDNGQHFLALQALEGSGSFHVAHGTNACKDDPWSPSCKSCWEVSATDFPECGTGWANPERDDPLNLRCFEQKRRFGLDFLHPIRRYVDALKEKKLSDGDDMTTDPFSPLFCREQERVGNEWQCKHETRDTSMVFIAGIVGVPWQDIAVDPTGLKKGYWPAEQLNWTPADFTANNETPPNGLPDGGTLWNMILGDTYGSQAGEDRRSVIDENGDGQVSDEEHDTYWRYGAIRPTAQPLDPLMIESVDPRSGTHPMTGVPLVQPGAGNPVGHPVNGSERTIEFRNDLQYACVFELGDFGPIDCSLPENAYGCECTGWSENPLCWNGNTYGSSQYRAKAYPGRRQLAVLKGAGAQAIVASVCPANMSNASAADFGYRPAVGAIVDRLQAALTPRCWEFELPIRDDGTVACSVLEARPGGDCACEGVRSEPTADEVEAIQSHWLAAEADLGCICRIAQAEPGPALDACTTETLVYDVEGWCYVDPSQDPSHNADLVARCPAGQQRTIRLLGQDVPARGAFVFVICD